MLRLKINPMVGMKAIQNGLALPFRFWTVIRSLDPAGAGWVKITDVYNTLKSWGIRKQYIDRWEHKSLLVGVISKDKKGERYYYQSVANSAIIFGTNRVMTPVYLEDPRKLFNRQWHCVVWACFIESLESDKPISRQSLRDITGIAERTQYKYEKQSGLIDVRPAWAIRENHQELDLSDKRFFIKDGQVRERLPNIYAPKIGNGLRKGKKGSTRNTNRKLKTFRGEKSPIVPRGKLYYSSAESAENGSKKYKEDKFYFSHISGAKTIYQSICYETMQV